MAGRPRTEEVDIQSSENRLSGMLRRIAWVEVLPWLLIFRSFRIAMTPTVIGLGTIGVLLTPIGWWLAAKLFLGSTLLSQVPELERAAEHNTAFGARIVSSADDFTSLESWIPWNSRGVLTSIAADYSGPYYAAMQMTATPEVTGDEEGQTTEPFAYGIRRFAYFSFGAIWMLAVWGLLAGAITRVAVVRLTRDERVGFLDAIRYAVKHYVSYLASPLMPLTIVLIFMLVMLIPGWLIWFGDFGALLMAIIWGLFLLLGLVIGLLVVVLSVCWPLMLPAISAEGGDGFDAVSRSYAYVYQRPLHYLFYATICVFLCALGGLLADTVSGGVVHMTRWCASWGAGSERMIEVTTRPPSEDATGEENEETPSRGMLNASRRVFGFWEHIVYDARTGFLYGLFWCAASSVYLLLRRSVDETELDEVYFDQGQTYDDLPSLEPPPALDGGRSSTDSAVKTESTQSSGEPTSAGDSTSRSGPSASAGETDGGNTPNPSGDGDDESRSSD